MTYHNNPNRPVYEAEIACQSAAEKLEAAAEAVDSRDQALAFRCRHAARVALHLSESLLPVLAPAKPADLADFPPDAWGRA